VRGSRKGIWFGVCENGGEGKFEVKMGMEDGEGREKNCRKEMNVEILWEEM